MIEIFPVREKEEGSYKASEILNREVNKNTLLLLSGGSSPDLLYQLLSNQTTFTPGAVALVDERFGEPGHQNSNELMIVKTGLADYFEDRRIEVYRILEKGEKRSQTARDYEDTVQALFKRFSKKVAVMGIGEDGHTAGIAPNRKDFQNPIFGDSYKNRMVGDFYDESGPFGERVTLTLKALEEIDLFVVLVFGKEKKETLKKIIDPKDQDVTTIPSVFYRNVKGRVYLITDQPV